MKRSVLFTFFIGYAVCLFAQVPIKVLDAKSLKPLVGANIYIDRKDGIAVTDSNGVFFYIGQYGFNRERYHCSFVCWIRVPTLYSIWNKKTIYYLAV